jgi:hypothetical protein
MNPAHVISCAEDFEAEINNGGFHQFFFNSPGNRTEETIQALELLGAKANAEMLRQAASRFPGKMPPTDRDLRQQILEEKFPITDEFEDLDNAFYANPENLSALMADYKRRFPDSFAE